MNRSFLRLAAYAAALTAAISSPVQALAFQDPDNRPAAQVLPNTGQRITPTAPRGARFQSLNPGLSDFPQYLAGQAVTTVVSPDKRTMLVLTSGFNRLNATSGPNLGNQIDADSNEYVFVYSLANKLPIKKQVVQVPNTYSGIVFDPSGTTFYVSGGVDDNVHIYDQGTSGWAERTGSPIALGHTAGVGLVAQPEAAGLAITADGTKMVVADYYNDSVSVLTKASNTWQKTGELDLRPGKISPSSRGVPGGEYPFWVAIKDNSTAYVSSLREREIDVISLAGSPTVTNRIKVTGQPNKMTLNSTQSRLYVAEDDSDSVAIIDTGVNQLLNEIAVTAPPGILPAFRAGYTGNNTNSVTLSPDETTLYATNGNTNDVAVVDLNTASVTGLIPTGWYPSSVSFSGDGKYMYVVNGKSPTGPNPGNCQGNVLPGKSAAECSGTNQYALQLIKAGLQSMPTPQTNQLPALTEQVAANNNFRRVVSATDQALLAALRSKIQHVIYIVKENRTYDQVLGDLEVGNGDPSLTEFGSRITPNQHNLARNFVTLDNFYDRSEVSMDGWPWSVSAQAPDVVEKQVTVNYAGRGLTYDSEGTNRNVNVGISTLSQRLQANPLSPNDPDVMPGTVDTAAPDGPDHEINGGYLWNAALRAGLSIRNYGFFIDLARYNLPAPYTQYSIPPLADPFATKTIVAYSTNAALQPYTDPYFRGFDNVLPDYYRFTEWQREFDTNYANGGLPHLSFVRFMHDHTGNFGTALFGINTPELQQADNDYAVGLLVQKIANSQYKNNTLIVVIEDDSQDAGDHVDSHRSIGFLAGPFVKQHAVISSTYNTADIIRTMEEILGISPMNLNDSVATPMTDVFDLNQMQWNFTATPSSLLAGTSLPIPSSTSNHTSIPQSTHSSAYWAAATKGMDFSAEDRIDFNRYNRILWQGLMGNRLYPETPSGLDLRKNRAALLKSYQQFEQKHAESTLTTPSASLKDSAGTSN